MLRQRLLLAVTLLGLELALADRAAAQSADTRFTVLHTFSGTARWPTGRLVEAPDGFFYGVTTSNGPASGGTVFRISKSGAINVVFTFGRDDGTVAVDGVDPAAGLVLGADGNLYGTTSRNGLSGSPPVGGLGTVFRITPAGALTTLHALRGDSDGAQPFAPLLLASDGNFYGTAVAGGPGGTGTIFRLTPAGTVSLVYGFRDDASDGGQLFSGLVEGPDGTLYGTTSSGGFGAIPDGGGGTIFALTKTGTLRTLHYFRFAGDPNGGNPADGLVFGADGALYGLTRAGTGTAIRITPAGAITLLHRFGCNCSTPAGAFPVGTLTLAADGNFYGVTSGGGVNNLGTVFRMTPSGQVTTLRSMSVADGESPTGGLLEASDGRLYGLTRGGLSGSATMFKVTLLPPAPAGLTITAADRRVTLRWNAVRSANDYTVLQGTAAGALSVIPAQSALLTTSVDITGLTNGTRYFFSVTAANEAGVGPRAAEISAVPVAVTSGLTATPGNGQITLRWDAATGATGYRVFRGTAPGVTGTTPIQTALTTTTFTDAGLTSGTTYHYAIANEYGTVIGPASTEVSASPTAPPPQPSGGGGRLDILLLGLLLLARLRAAKHVQCRSIQLARHGNEST